MLDTAARRKLSDPSYFALHLQAIMAIREVEGIKWYDSHFLRRLEIVKRYLGRVRPDALEAVLAGFKALLPSPGFREISIDRVFDESTHRKIIEASRAAKPDRSTQCDRENADFGRDVIWDEPYFLALQEEIRPWIEAVVGRPLVCSYNFLSLYGGQGKCDLHMDHPNAMYTFVYCIEQDTVWPIYISRTTEWPDVLFAKTFDPQAMIADPRWGFTEHLLRPNQALVFNGSSQWHYRQPKTSGGFCHLLFFHYYPAGCEKLVEPALWAEHFALPELEPLCDLFGNPAIDGFDVPCGENG